MFVRKCFAVVSFFMMALFSSLFSQITLEGSVLDNGSEPVQNAMVELTDQADANRKFVDYTNAQGIYKIKIVETGVYDSESLDPGIFKLSQNYPNPFNPSTVISYELSRPAFIRIEIYNILGQKTKSLFDGFQPAGVGRLRWDATDDLDQGVPAGVYIYSLSTDGIRINNKMLLIDGQQGSSTMNLSQSMRTDGSDRYSLSKPMSNLYILKISGNDIETYEEQNLEITGNSFFNVRVYRTATDIDGNIYRLVKIGFQWWTAENLKVTRYQNGDVIPNVTDNTEWSNLTTGACCEYNNETDSAATWGRLYNWYTVNDSRNIAPSGWHVPTDADWQILIDLLGGIGNAGGKMKEAGNAHWLGPNTSATNESGFSALPGGNRYENGFFGLIANYAYFWSSTETDSLDAWTLRLGYNYSGVLPNDISMHYGLSVRCIKDY